MAISITGKKIRITDKTIMNIFRLNNNIDIYCLNKIISYLEKIGVDNFEVDKKWMVRYGTLISNKFIMRIRFLTDIELIKKMNINEVVINIKNPKFNTILSKLIEQNVNITIEYEAENIDELEQLKNYIFLKNIKKINRIIISNLSNISVESEWKKIIESFKEKTGFFVDVYPFDSFCSATSTAIESAISFADGIICAFNGIEGKKNVAPLEEVIAYLSLIINKNNEDLSILQDLKNLYYQVTKIEIDKSKPIIGDNIFLVESGIHIDGILKNPNTYEPYNPLSVGIKRGFVLGKHSGRKAIVEKLKEYKINYENIDIDMLLKTIKENKITINNKYEAESVIKLLNMK
ncbi:hypothetical protein ACAG39_05500 [Caldicellulosiruptoraceae bacterium PP1]